MKLTFRYILPEICFDQNKTTNGIQVLVGSVAFFGTLQVDAKNQIPKNLDTDRSFTFISTIFHNSKVKFMLYISPKFEVLTTKTFCLGEVQSWMTFFTVEIGYMFCVKLRFLVHVMKCLKTKEFW